MAFKTLFCALPAAVLAMCSAVQADETLSSHVPLVMWSANPLFRGSNVYLSATLDAPDVANVLNTAANRDMAHDQWNVLNHREILFPTAEIMCVFLRESLSTQDLSSLAPAGGESSFVQNAVKNSKSSVALPQTIRSKSLSSSLPTEGLYKTEADQLNAFLASATGKQLLTNDKSDILVVQLPADVKGVALDNVMKTVSKTLSSATKNRVDFALTGNTAEVSSIPSSRRLATSETGTAASLCAAGYLLGTKNGKQFCFSHFVYMTPEVLTGVILGLFFLFLAYVGLSALNGIQTPTRYPLHGPPKGKEF